MKKTTHFILSLSLIGYLFISSSFKPKKQFWAWVIHNENYVGGLNLSGASDYIMDTGSSYKFKQNSKYWIPDMDGDNQGTHLILEVRDLEIIEALNDVVESDPTGNQITGGL